MHTFKDMNDREWKISLTIGAIKRVRDLLDIHLMELDKGDPPLLTRLGLDPMLLVDIIYVLVKSEADARNISDEEFGGSLGGEAIMAAQDAFYEELILFFQGLRRADLVTALKTQKELVAKAIAEVNLRLQKFDPAKMVEKAFASGELSTKSLELLE